MHREDDDPLLPVDPEDRIGFGIQCFFIFSLATYGATKWPPQINAQGTLAIFLKALCLEFILLMIPFGLLGMIWAVATPEWVRYFLNLCFKHLTIVIVLCAIMAGVAIAFMAAGIW
ncbi:MAG: hypothetical protein AB8G99_02560 [Planctomycetaceae bacterium]